MARKLKTDDKGQLQADANGNPIVVYEDGREAALDWNRLIDNVKSKADEAERVGGELAKAREQLKQFEGLDPEKVREALNTIKNLDGKKLVEANKVDELVKERLKEHLEESARKLAAKEEAIAERDKQLWQLSIGTEFKAQAAEGGLLTDYLAPLQDTAELLFGKHFVIENGRAVGYRRLPGTNGKDDAGEKIYNPQTGEPAGFRDALASLISAHPSHDRWKKSPNASGSGAPGAPKAPPSGPDNNLTPEQRLEQHWAGKKSA